MSRTDKDLPYHVQVKHAAPHDLIEDHAPGCEHSNIPARQRYESVKREVGTQRVRRRFIKMIDGNGVFFGAQVGDRDRWGRKSEPVYIYDREVHPDARPHLREVVIQERVEGEYVPVTIWVPRTYDKWVTEPVIETVLVPIENEVRPCDLSGPKAGQSRWSSECSLYVHLRHRCRSTPEMRRLDFYKPERADVRSTLQRARDEYNTYGETDIEPIPHTKRRGPYGGGYWD